MAPASWERDWLESHKTFPGCDEYQFQLLMSQNISSTNLMLGWTNSPHRKSLIDCRSIRQILCLSFAAPVLRSIWIWFNEANKRRKHQNLVALSIRRMLLLIYVSLLCGATLNARKKNVREIASQRDLLRFAINFLWPSRYPPSFSFSLLRFDRKLFLDRKQRRRKQRKSFWKIFFLLFRFHSAARRKKNEERVFRMHECYNIDSLGRAHPVMGSVWGKLDRYSIIGHRVSSRTSFLDVSASLVWVSSSLSDGAGGGLSVWASWRLQNLDGLKFPGKNLKKV